MQSIKDKSTHLESDPALLLLNEYKAALLSGDAAGAGIAIDKALASGISPSKVYISILMPTQIDIAKLLSDSKVGISEHDKSTQIMLSEMAKLRSTIKPLSRLGVKAMIACIDGEEHDIGARVIADFLFIDGWEVHFLGCGTPTRELLELIESTQFDLVGLTATTSDSLEALQETIKKIKEINSPPKIILGGTAVYKELDKANSFGADGVGLNAEDTSCLARRLCGISTQDSTLAHYLKSLGDRIFELRKSRKFSQQKLAKSAGLDRAYISSVENGKQNVSVGAIAKLADALGVTLEELLVGKVIKY